MISSILRPRFPANHIDGTNPAVYSSVLSHSWPQNQISHVGGWAKGMFQQIPTEVGRKADIPVPLHLCLPLKVWSQGKLEPVSFGDPIQLYLEWRKTHVCDLIQADRARDRATSPHRLVPRAILDANFCFKWIYKDSYSTHTNRGRLKPWWPSHREPDVPPFLPMFQVRQSESGPLYLTLWDPKSLSIWHLS